MGIIHGAAVRRVVSAINQSRASMRSSGVIRRYGLLQLKHWAFVTTEACGDWLTGLCLTLPAELMVHHASSFRARTKAGVRRSPRIPGFATLRSLRARYR
jgi:hypothetical protein